MKIRCPPDTLMEISFEDSWASLSLSLSICFFERSYSFFNCGEFSLFCDEILRKTWICLMMFFYKNSEMCFFSKNSLIPSNSRLKNTAYSVGNFCWWKDGKAKCAFCASCYLQHVNEKI
jgi:hypothetical protein